MHSESKSSTVKANLLNYASFSAHRNAIYGMAALWIVLFHGTTLEKVARFEPLFLYNTINMGNIGVDVFILLSGIGLYFSYSKSPRLGEFYRKRFVRVYIPYLLMTLPYIITIFVNGEIDLGLFIRAIFTVNFWTGEKKPIDFWYISAILVFYLLYPLIHRFIFRRKLKHERQTGGISTGKREFLRMLLLAAVPIAIGAVMFYCCYDIYIIIDRVPSRLAVFVIGTYMGRLVKEKRRFNPIFLIAAVLIVVGSYPLYQDMLLVGFWNRCYGSLTGIALVYIWSQIFTLLSVIRADKIFAFFGTFSLEIYIIAILFRKLFVKTEWYDGYVMEHYVIAMLIALAAAWLVSLIEKPILKLLLKSRHKESAA